MRRAALFLLLCFSGRVLGQQDTAGQIQALVAEAWTHYSHNELAETSALFQRAMDLASQSNLPAVRAELLASFAVLHNRQEDFPKAIAEFTEAGAIYKSLKDPTAEAQMTSFLANSWRMRAQAEERAQDTTVAIESHRRAGAIYEQVKDYNHAGNEYVRIGQLFRTKGDPAALLESEDAFQKAVPLLKSGADRAGLVSALWGLGSVAGALGENERSRDALREALPLLDQLREPKAQGIVLHLLANAEAKLGDAEGAAEHYGHALTLFTLAGDALNMFISGMKRGKMQEALGQTDQALATYVAVAANAHAAGQVLDEATARGSAGMVEYARRKWKPALEALSNAQKLHASLGKKVDEAGDWLMIGSCYSRQGQYREKLAADLRALELVQGGADRRLHAQVLTEIGDSYNSLHRSREAMENLEHARSMADGDEERLALVLVEMGEVRYDETKLDEALVFENQALDLARKLNQPGFVSRIRNSIALTRQARGERKEAGQIFQENLAEARKSKDVQAVASALHNLGKLRQDFGDNPEAARLFEESLALEEADGDRKQAAITLDALGTTYHAMGQNEKALVTLNRSHSEWQSLGDVNGEAISLNNAALIYNEMGRPQQAIESMQEAIAIRRSLEDEAGVATLLRSLGGIYQTLGDYDRARSYLAKALETQQKFRDEHAQAVTHNSIGVIEINEHEPQAALREFDGALALFQRFGDRAAEATTLSNEANVLLEQGEFSKAEAAFHRSLALARETHNVNLEALSVHGLGSVYEKSGELDRARGSLRQAIPLWHTLHEVSPEAKALSLLAQVDLKRHDLKAALEDCDESIRLLESQRGGLGSEDLRAYYLASIAGPYKVKVDVLMAMHRAHPGAEWDARAFEASESSRARSLLDLLAESRIDVTTGADPKMAAADKAAQQAISMKAVQLRKLTPDSGDFQALDLEIAELTAERERIAFATRGERKAVRPMTLRDVQEQVLDARTMLLEYSLGEYRSYLFAVTSTGISSYELPKRADLVQAAQDVFLDLQGFQVDRMGLRKNAEALSAVLLGQVAKQMSGKRLVIVPDGELAFVPFAFLPDPLTGQPLMVGNEIVNLPSVSTAAAIRVETAHRKKPAKEIAVIADPTFSGMGLTRLEHSKKEAESILALAPAGRSLALMGAEASRANVLGERLANYRLVHFATHGLVDNAHAQLSGLALSDGFLEMNAIFGMKLRADLVVLSACESGQGKLVGGEGMMSLARGFLHAGAAALVVSGWRVDDEATSELMKRFYAGMLGKGRLRPAAALQNAQRSMLLNSRWSDPYYWAAFSLQGDWR